PRDPRALLARDGVGWPAGPEAPDAEKSDDHDLDRKTEPLDVDDIRPPRARLLQQTDQVARLLEQLPRPSPRPTVRSVFGTRALHAPAVHESPGGEESDLHVARLKGIAEVGSVRAHRVGLRHQSL